MASLAKSTIWLSELFLCVCVADLKAAEPSPVFTLGPLTGHTTPGVTPLSNWGQSYVADLNHDGYDDYIQTGAYYPNEAPPAVDRKGFVLFGTAAGFVQASEAEFPSGALLNVHAREAAFADFNKDGTLDMFIADHGYDAYPFPGQQNLLFMSTGAKSWRDATANVRQQKDFTHSTTVGDVNGDGWLDIFVGNPNQTTYLLLNTGNGSFTANDSLLPKNAGQTFDSNSKSFTSSLLTDLDGDGRDDFVFGAAFSTVTAPNPPRIIWNHNGSLSQDDFTTLPFPATFGAKQLVYDIQATDVNFDGKQDLVLAYQADTNLGGWELQILINQGNHVFADQTPTYLKDPAVRSGGDPANGGSLAWIEFLQPRDFNHDGRMDFFIEHKAWGKPLPDSFPLMLIHQADGHYEVVTAGVLSKSGMPRYMLDYGLHYAERGTGHSAELFQVFPNTSTTPGQVEMSVAAINFADLLPHWLGGTAQADQLKGGKEDDLINGFGGDDTLDGGDGIDTAVYSGKLSEYTWSRTTSSWKLTDTRGVDGVDTLQNIERLRFADTSVALDINGNAGTAVKIINAVFGKSYLSNKEFIGIALGLLDKGMSYRDVATLAVNTTLFGSLAGSHSNIDLVNYIYKNVIGQLPTPTNLSYFVNLLNNGAESQGSLAYLASESLLNQQNSNLDDLIKRGLEFTPAK